MPQYGTQLYITVYPQYIRRIRDAYGNRSDKDADFLC